MDEDNIFAALEHRDRVRNVTLRLTRSQLEKVAVAMREPFPALSRLKLSVTTHRSVPIHLDGFLGGNTSSLQEISLYGISFPGLAALLSSASHLISLRLGDLWHLFSPETLVTSLAAATRLESLFIDFNPEVTLSQNHARPPSRAILPALTRFQFRGDYTHLEDLVARIDCPKLKSIDVLYVDDVDSSQLCRFLDLSEALKLNPLRRARVDLDQQSINLDGSRADPHPTHLCLEFPHHALEVRVVRQLLVSASAMLTTVRHLTIGKLGHQSNENFADWIELFRLFPALESLHVGGELTMTIGSVLNKSKAAGGLLALRFLSLDGPPTRSVLRFISARQVSDCPVTLIKTREEFESHVAC
jgi:hypothetical protein